jgi:hypothetical protein
MEELFLTMMQDIAPNRYVYDLVLTSGSVNTRLLEGKFIVTPGVTV